MTTERTRSILELSSALSPTGAETLLAMGLGVSERPIDRVARRLQDEDGAAWYELARKRLADELGVSLAAIRSNPATPLDQLREHKAAIKRWSNDADEDTRQIGVLGYFLVLAVGMRHHAMLITEQPKDQIADAWRLLSEALPDPWPDDLRVAIDRLCAADN